MVIVLRGNFRSSVHRLFALYLLALAVWGIVIFGMRASPDIEHALSWDVWTPVLGMFISAILYHFSVRYTGTRIRRWLIPSLYLFCLIFTPLVARDLLITGMEVRPFGYAPVLGPLAPVYILFGLGLLIASLVTFINRYRTSAFAEQRNRYLYIITGIGISLLGGFFDVLPALGLPLYPGYIIGNITFCLVTTVAIVRHKLLDIHVVLRKGTAYALTTIIAAIPFVTVFIILAAVTTQEVPRWIYIILVIALAFLLPQLWRLVQRMVDKWFYRDRYDYLRALENFSRDIQSFTSLTTLGSTMVNLVVGVLRTSSVHLLLSLDASDRFVTVASAPASNATRNISLRSQSPLVKWLTRSRGTLSSQDLDCTPLLQCISLPEKQSLERAGVDLIAPLKTRSGDLSGILLLGRKLSQQPYTVEDHQLIYTLSSQMAVQLDNARLYNDVLRSRQNLERWLNSMTDCVLIVSTDYTIEFMNKTARDRFGDSLGQKCWKSLGMASMCPNCPVQHDIGDSSAGLHYTNNIRNREYDIAVAPLLNPDGSSSAIEVLRDVTERKRVEERERQLQQELHLSGHLASIGELAAGVAHEINNPLTGILGFSQRVLSTDEAVRHDLERVCNEAARAAKVVENLLTFARRREPKKEYADVNEVVARTLELKAYELRTSNIALAIELTPGLPEIILDVGQIQQVFLNIIMNAEQAMTEAHGGGKLSIKTEQIKRYIRISFTNDGPEIPKEHLQKLFDPFFTTRGERGGTGLGLSICHGIVREHGGRICARREPRKGVTFFVELPLTAAR